MTQGTITGGCPETVRLQRAGHKSSQWIRPTEPQAASPVAPVEHKADGAHPSHAHPKKQLQKVAYGMGGLQQGTVSQPAGSMRAGKPTASRAMEMDRNKTASSKTLRNGERIINPGRLNKKV